MSLLAASLLKSLIKGLCVAIEYTHQMVALLVRRRILRIAFFKKKFRIPPCNPSWVAPTRAGGLRSRE